MVLKHSELCNHHHDLGLQIFHSTKRNAITIIVNLYSPTSTTSLTLMQLLIFLPSLQIYVFWTFIINGVIWYVFFYNKFHYFKEVNFSFMISSLLRLPFIQFSSTSIFTCSTIVKLIWLILDEQNIQTKSAWS